MTRLHALLAGRREPAPAAHPRPSGAATPFHLPARSLATLLVTLLAALTWLPASPCAAEPAGAPDPEIALVAALADARAGRTDAALAGLEALIRSNPNFRLARLVYADLLFARSGRVGAFGAARGLPAANLDDLRAEAEARLSHHREGPPADALPAALIKLAPSQKRVLLVDQARARLYVYANEGGRLRLVGDYYVSAGKNGARKEREGDQRTPVGVYFITSRLAAEELEDFYGAGALPVNYPNEWDERLGRTGYGIWIHGVPSDTYSRPPRASDGCLVLPNGDLAPLLQTLDAGTTPVVIAERLAWTSEAALASRREGLLRALEAWRRDWESLDGARYARHYAADFSAGGRDLLSWLAHRHAADAGKAFLQVNLEDLSLLAYPGERDLVTVSFVQDYRSDDHAERSNRRQYWRRGSDGRWRIVHEGPATFQAEHFRGIPWSARSRLTRLSR